MTGCILARIGKRIHVQDDGCWAFTGAIQSNGYGRVFLGGQMVYPHRVMFEALRGPIPDGLDLDHLCRNRACCNPFHLEPVTRRENLMRGTTLTRAHADGVDCGFEKCRACRRHRQEVAS